MFDLSVHVKMADGATYDADPTMGALIAAER